jgi:hypothetical protein
VGPALQGVEGHLPGTAHLLHPPVEIGHVRGQHVVAGSGTGFEQVPDLLERHPRRLAPLDDRYPHQVVAAIATAACGVPLGREQPHVLPVPEHMRPDPEPVRDLPDRPTG